MARFKDCDSAYREMENALATGALSVPFLYALQAFSRKEKRLPPYIDGTDHLEDLAKRCFAHDATLRLKELNKTGIDNIENPVSEIDKIIGYANLAEDYWGAEIDMPALKKKKTEAHAVMARRVLKEYSKGLTNRRDIPLAFNSFMKHFDEAVKGEKSLVLSANEGRALFKLAEASQKNAPALAEALFFSLPAEYRSKKARSVSEHVAKQASCGTQSFTI
jgi:hypothetical protein